MQTHFFVARDGEQSGPFSIDEVIAKIESKQLDLSDYVYDEATSDWVVLMAYPLLAERMAAARPTVPPKSLATHAAEQAELKEKSRDPKAAEWFVLKGDNKFGPFAYVDLLKMLQDKSVFEYDYVWYKGLETWMRIAELPDFKPERIRHLKDSQLPELTEVFFRRRHARVSHGGSILVHDNKNVWKGQSVEVSAGGAGIVVENALLQPGQTVFLHFKPGDGLPPFNATCEVVSKKFTQVNDRNSPVQYGVKFTSINAQTQVHLRDYTDRKRSA